MDAYEEGIAAALRGEEAAPGCTATPQGRAFLDGYIEGRRRLASARADASALAGATLAPREPPDQRST